MKDDSSHCSASGWPEWLIDTFGEHVGMCKEQPFETGIEIQQST